MIDIPAYVLKVFKHSRIPQKDQEMFYKLGVDPKTGYLTKRASTCYRAIWRSLK